MSSSGHVAAARVLWGLEGDEAMLHAGSLAALCLGCRSEAAQILRRLTLRRVAMHLAAGAIPAVAGFALEKRAARLPVAPGLLAGSLLLLAGEGGGGSRSRWDAGPRDGLWFGVAQSMALWPGVSRNGATLAVARRRGFARTEANPLSREVGVPVTLGAVALACAKRSAPTLQKAQAAAFVSTFAAFPAMRWVDRGGPLWPFAVERAGLALLLLRESRR